MDCIKNKKQETVENEKIIAETIYIQVDGEMLNIRNFKGGLK